MVLTVSFGLSPVTNSFCHRRPRIEGSSKPGRAESASANLTPATGARTTRLRRPQQRRSSCAPFDRSRVAPPCDHSLRATLPRPSHLAPTSVTTRTPLLPVRDSVEIAIDWGQMEAIYFRRQGLDDPNQIESSRQIAVCVDAIFRSVAGC